MEARRPKTCSLWGPGTVNGGKSQGIDTMLVGSRPELGNVEKWEGRSLYRGDSHHLQGDI